MTTYFQTEKNCAICGTAKKVMECGSFSMFGFSDLDFRPTSQARYMFYSNLDECYNCGFISSNIEDESYANAFKKISITKSYKTCDGIKFATETAQKFYRNYLINREVHGLCKETFYALQETAWVCDDDNDLSSGIKCRTLGLAFIDEVIKTNKNSENLTLIKLDFLRRCNRFDEVISFNKNFSQPLYQNTLKYQKLLSKLKVNDCHNLAEVDYLYEK